MSIKGMMNRIAKKAVDGASFGQARKVLQQQGTFAQAPPWMFALGAAGAGVSVARSLLWLVKWHPPLAASMVLNMICTISVALGLLGLSRIVGSRLLGAAAWLSFFKAAVFAVSYLLEVSGVWSGPGTMTWLIYIASDILTAVALLGADRHPHGLRKWCGWLMLIAGGSSLLSFASIRFQLSMPEFLMWGGSSLLHVGISATMAIFFYAQYKIVSR